MNRLSVAVPRDGRKSVVVLNRGICDEPMKCCSLSLEFIADFSYFRRDLILICYVPCLRYIFIA